MKKILSLVFSFLLLVSLFSTSMEVYAAVADAKIDADLKSAISESDTGTSMAYVTLDDVDHDAVMKQFQEKYPVEYKTYMFAKFDDPGDMTAEEIAAIDDALMQRAIECKREVYREYYTAQNESVIGRYYSEDEIVFTSQYAPMVIVETDTTEATRLARSHNVLSVDHLEDIKFEPTTTSSVVLLDKVMDGLDISNQISGADYVRDELGYAGNGVKVGVLEAENCLPDLSSPYLTGADITVRASDLTKTVDAHATTVVSIISAGDTNGDFHGVAPDAEIYYCTVYYVSEFFSGINWLINSGVNVINLSLEVGITPGQYDMVSAWLDHIAVQHDVHVVIAAGNGNLDAYDLYGVTPGMAYNAITVGCFESGTSTSLSDFVMSDFSRYIEKDPSTVGVRPEKPNLIANGSFADAEITNNIIDPYDGTSFSAPQVTGVIAQLCSYNSALKYKQTAVGAILMASSVRKVNAFLSGNVGGFFATAHSLSEKADANGNTEKNLQISDKAGAGILDARRALEIAAAGNFWSPTVYNASFPYVRTIYIDPEANISGVNRVAIIWLKRNSVSSHTSADVDASTYPLADLDLYILDPDGNEIGNSRLAYSNFEIVQFVPIEAGTYTIRITGSSSEKEYIGIAFW